MKRISLIMAAAIAACAFNYATAKNNTSYNTDKATYY
jgi:hypothetical protein